MARRLRVATGFVDEVDWWPAHFVAHGDALMRAAPVRVLSVLGSLTGYGAALGQVPALARLRKLVIPPVHGEGDDLVALGRSPHLTGLPALRVENLQVDQRLIARLDAQVFPGLRELELINCTVEPAAWPAVVELVAARGLTTLDLTSTRVPAAIEAELRARLGEGLRPRPVRRGTRPDDLRARLRFGKLDLSDEPLDAPALTALLASGPFPDVTALILGGSFGDAGVAALATSRAFPSLVSLSVAGASLAAASALASSAVGLDHLATISFGEIVRTGADGRLGPGDDAILALAGSPALPALRKVICGKEWRAYSEGAREEAITQPVTRDDGSVVDCVIYHSIWP